MADKVKGLRIELDGSEDALKALGNAVEAAEHPAALFDAIGAALVTSTQYRFETETGPDGAKWPPSMRVLEAGGKTLTDTAYLVGSITHEADDAGVAVGTNVIYAAIHQLGGVIKPVNAEALAFSFGGQQIFAKQVTIPARPFLGLDDDDEEIIELIAAEWVETAIDATAGGARVNS